MVVQVKSFITISIFALAFASAPAFAELITVPNFSFEDQDVDPASVITGSPPGWTLVGSGGVFQPDINQGFVDTLPLSAPAQGDQYAYLETGNANPGLITLTTDNSLATVSSGTIYTLTAALGHRAWNSNGGRRPDDYLIELLVDGIPVASNTLDDAHTNIPEGTWVDLSTSFTAVASGGDLTIRLSHSSSNASVFRQGAFDNIRLEATAAVPEPNTLFGMLALFITSFLRRRRRCLLT